MAFMHVLRELREESGLSQAKLADLAGVPQRTIANLEQGRNEPTLATAQALAAALGVDCTAFNESETRSISRKPARRGRPRKK